MIKLRNMFYPFELVKFIFNMIHNNNKFLEFT